MFGGVANHHKCRAAWRCVTATAIVVTLCVCSRPAAVLAEGASSPRSVSMAPTGPLQMADTSSPRATLKSFNDACTELYAIIQANHKFRGGRQPPPAAIQAFRCLDISHIPPAVVDGVAADSLVELKEVLDRIEIPPEKEIPDARKMEELIEAGEPARWRIPNTEITIALVTEGPRVGEYLFTQSTVDHTSEYYERVKHISYKPGAAEGFRDWYLSEPGG
jgi:MscS family membrane protein